MFTPTMYPNFSVKHITNPNRFYAFPILGIVVKVLMLIPVFIWMFFLGIALFVMMMVNSLSVLFSGKYLDSTFNLLMYVTCMWIKLELFATGLSNTYPGFSNNLDNHEAQVSFTKPTHPNRWFAIPIFGGICRIILLIPYLIFTSVIGQAGKIGVFASFVPVLFTGKYPESTYELERDAMRLSLSASLYMSGVEDRYPSFTISWAHKTVKIVLIVLAVLSMLNRNHSSSSNNYRYQYNQQNYNNQQMMNGAQYK